jgi:Domain of unknown function (DUF5666)
MLRFFASLASGLVILTMLTAATAIAKDGIIEINGVVQAKPASFIGDWTIAGRTVRADAATVFKQELGPIGVGALVEVKGVQAADGAVVAQTIEVKQAVGTTLPPPGQPEPEINGAIEALPASGLLGMWKVGGRTVMVMSTTQINQEHGGVAVGAIVQVHGTLNADQSIAASRIEVKSSTLVTPNPGAPTMEIQGTIDVLPAGLLGTWTVAGHPVLVDAATVLNVESGSFAVGATVEVHAKSRADGQIIATRIERKPGIGAPVPAARFWGRVTSLPPTGFLGVWKIDSTIIIDVTAATAIHVNNGPIAIGAIVEVSGWPQLDGVIVADEVETRTSIGQMSAQGTTVVEYRNTLLGHFFVTASAAEIAMLDAGAFNGAWQRTGESFKTGGTQAVCRFYGMPPRGPNSHFFTASATECEQVMGNYSAWTFEDHAFAVTPATNGQCPAGLIPVHRFYNNPTLADDMNHRFTTTVAAFNATIALGWMHEGVVMCAHP